MFSDTKFSTKREKIFNRTRSNKTCATDETIWPLNATLNDLKVEKKTSSHKI